MTSAPVTIPAPNGGWMDRIDTGQPNAARVMENMFPTTQGARVRGGKQKVATVGARVRAMFTYKTGTTEKMFATTASAIYDVSALDPDTVPAASVSGLSNGNYYAAQLGTVGGEYMFACNGANDTKLFDGTNWSNATFTGVTTSLLSFVWVHKNRYWFVEKNTKRAWALPVGSITGAAVDVPLDGVFQKGGSLLFGVTWSEDAGDGMDDRIAFVSTEGEIAIYEGSDPTNAATWALVGLYQIPKPMGPKCVMRAGGDVLIGTVSGLYPLSAALAKDPSALDVVAVSAPIDQSWRRDAAIFDNSQPWELAKWPSEAMLLVTLPHKGDTCYVANLTTGRWGKYIGWDAQCATLFGDRLYFGEKTGAIYAAETGGNDDGAAYTARVSMMPNDIGNLSAFKQIGAARATFFCSDTLSAQVSASVDYAVNFPSLPVVYAPEPQGGALWDVDLWDGALWDDDGLGAQVVRPIASTGWTSVAANGYAISPQVQMVVNGSGRPTAELILFELSGELGGAIV